MLTDYDDLRLWYGVIFVRRGLYGGGIFKFKYQLPPDYPGEGTRPTVTFTSRVFHPLVDPEVRMRPALAKLSHLTRLRMQNGELELFSKFPKWDPELHYTVSVLTYIKKIFYSKDFSTDGALNEVANEL